MKRLGLTFMVAFFAAATTFAADNQPVKEGTAKQWEGQINVNKLSKFLQLTSDQHEQVSNICDYFNEQMVRANRSQKNHEKMLRNAVFGNLKLMKQTLSEKQYTEYAKVLQATLQNKGITLE